MNGSGPGLDRSIAFALLAAGSARRFGGGKLSVELASRPLLCWAAQAADRAGFQMRILVVASADQPDFGLARNGWTVIVNSEAETGIASSIRAAARAARRSDRLVLALADMPFVSAAHFCTIALAEGVVFTRYPTSRYGVPAGFDRKGIAELGKLRGDSGASSLDWPNATAIVPPSAEELFDIDSEHDLAKARSVAIMR